MYHEVITFGPARIATGVSRNPQDYTAFTCSMKAVIATIVAVAVFLALDKYYLDGRYTDAALAMLSEIRRGFGF
jgi:hypothetical protein